MWKPFVRSIVVAVILPLVGDARTSVGQTLELDLTGYVKDLAALSTASLTGESFFVNTLRNRMQVTAGYGPHLSAEAWFDTEYLATLNVDADQFRSSATPEFADLSWSISSGARHEVRQSLFRATLSATKGSVRAVVGRQRIAWGSGFVWTPTDVLNPVSPIALERDEKAGVDAAYVDYALGPMTRMEAVVAPSRNSDRTSAAARMSSHLGEYDMAAMGGRVRDTWIFGGDFAGYAGDAGVRGEAAYTHTENDDFLRAVVNADYNFPGDYYSFMELHYNGAGSSKKAEYDYTQLLDGQTLNLAQFYAAGSVAKNVSPLVAATFYGILNLNDGSGLAGPALLWNAREELEISASAYVFFGADDTEYGPFGNVYFLIVQYFF